MAKDKEPPEAGIPVDPEANMSEDEIDRNLIETFPASDPPSWTLGTDHRDKPLEKQGDESDSEG